METARAIEIIDLFGGINALARALPASTATVHAWKTKGIPRWRMAQIEQAARRLGLTLPPAQQPLPEAAA